jgi:hypothetical protein
MAPSRRALIPWATSTAVALLLILLAGPLFSWVAANRLRGVATARGLTVSWRSLAAPGFLRLRLTGLAVRSPERSDTLFASDSVSIALDPWSLLRLHPRPSNVELWRSRAKLGRGGGATIDTLVPEVAPPDREGDPARAARLRRAAESLALLLAAPAREMPRLALNEFRIDAGAGEGAPWRGMDVGWLEIKPEGGGARVASLGSLLLDQEVPFRASLVYGRDDRIEGEARLEVPRPEGRERDPLRIAFQGRLHQDRRAGSVTLRPGTRVWVGRLPLELSGRLSRRGPSLHVELIADTITEARLESSLPRPVLGPLTEVGVEGWWAYRVSLDLDLARPDSVTFTADVIPHGLRLDPNRTYLRLFGLDQPFLATIHLPRGREATRMLDDTNPHFRPLDRIAPDLVHAVLTNEDGGFYHHRGFNTEAVRRSIATNLKAGAFRRGAGTITMQLARNLYLGHERTISRKAQEVVLAWVIEHLTGLSKDRLLEIYLNIIEWGPEVHGADEAARFYFARDARDLRLPEALFLATVVPGPRRWMGRFEADGSLKPWERAQMHFIGRAMIAKGWLTPEALPPAESLNVALAGPARALLFPDTSAAEETRAGSPI